MHLSEALENFGKTLLIYRNKFPGEKARIYETYREIALIHYRRLENKEAARWLTDALKLSEELYGEENKNTIFCLGYLGMIYQNLNEDVQAESYFWRAMEAAEKVYENDPDAYERYSDAYSCFTSTTRDSKVGEIVKSRQAAGKKTTEVLKTGNSVINGQAISLPKPSLPPQGPRSKGKSNGQGHYRRGRKRHQGAGVLRAQHVLESDGRSRFEIKIQSHHACRRTGENYRFDRI